jgi:hypothetical protein
MYDVPETQDELQEVWKKLNEYFETEQKQEIEGATAGVFSLAVPYNMDASNVKRMIINCPVPCMYDEDDVAEMDK